MKRPNLRTTTFLIYVLLAFVISYLPIINWPFSWWTQFFHELSKVLCLLLSGGPVFSIELSLRGIGSTTTQGGNIWFVTSGGYCGSILWGILIFLLADHLDKKHSILEAIGLTAVILLSTLLWVRDIVTLFILIFIAILLLSIIKFHHHGLMKMVLKFIGIYVVLDAIRAPLNLLDGRIPFDLIPLVQESLVFTYFLACLWFFLGLLGLYVLWCWHNPSYEKRKISEHLLKFFD